MKQYILTFLLLITSSSLFGQNDNIWTSFLNSDTTLIGYKDKNGVVKIEPRFDFLTTAGKFDNIIAVQEDIYGEYRGRCYYLTKMGKMVGRDSMYIFDNGFDCESEGFIRFKDKKTDKAGMFDKNGEIVIPAEYSDLTRVRNGMIIVLKDAEREYAKNGDFFSWRGGKELLIDTLNNVLIENFPYTTELNFYSIEITQTPSLDNTRENFKATDGSYYSFVNFEKEFKNWLTNDLLINLTSQKLIDASYDTITWWSTEGWIKNHKQHFINNNFETLKTDLLEMLDPDCDYFLFLDRLNHYMYEGVEFEHYFNNCGEAKEWIYPVMELVINHNRKEKDWTQNHYDFLRTNNGYRLISVTIRN